MLKRIIGLNDIGRFASLKSVRSNEGDFANVNVVYAPNACGKTTLCDVFRSLGTQNPAYILGRRRVGDTVPSVDFLFDDNSHGRFNSGQWELNPKGLDIHVYDQRFVNENVFVGGQIGIEQKRNVYRLALGQKAIELNKAVQDAGEELTRATESVSRCETVLSTLIPKKIPIEAFRRLEKVDDVETKITELKERIATESNKKSKAEQIRNHQMLQKINVPTISKSALIDILSATLDDVALTAERKIKEHLDRCTDTTKVPANWITQGYEVQKGDFCPYCGQDMSCTEMFATYRAFFSGALKQQEVKRNEVISVFQKELGTHSQNSLSNVITQNLADLDWWKDACGLLIEVPILFKEQITETYANTLDVVSAVIERKQRNLTTRVSLQDDEACFIDSINTIVASIQDYNRAIEMANEKIETFQRSIALINVNELRSELEDLELKRVRYEVGTISAFQKYDEALAAKKQAQDIKTKKNEALKQESRFIFETFGQAINGILSAFGVNFRVQPEGVNLRGGTATGQLAIEINANGGAFKVDCSLDAADNPMQMSLVNTLSGGDCSALGLAFFLAKLELDANCAHSIVVIDDPYHGQDRSRQAQTISLLTRLAKRCLQFFLFSHDLEFAQMFMANKSIARPDIRAFKIPEIGSSIELEYGQLPQLPSKSYETDYQELHGYMAKPEDYQDRMKEVVGRIRPLLETYLHYKYPLKWKGTQWLGDMIGAIRNAESGDCCYACKSVLPLLEDVNNYTQRFHHRVTGVAADVPDPRELKVYVEKTLQVIHHA